MKPFDYKNVKIIEKKVAYQGFFKLSCYTLQHTLFKGGYCKPIVRECFERGHAVGVLAYDPWQDTIVLLKQFRIGAYSAIDEYLSVNENGTERINDTHSPWLLEVIAGIVEPGESDIDVAHREAYEEAGLTLIDMEAIGNFYSSPGGTSETTQLYCACVNTNQAGGVYGLVHEGEDIQVRVYPYDEVVSLLKSGQLNNACTMITVQWLMLNKNMIQEKWCHSEK